MKEFLSGNDDNDTGTERKIDQWHETGKIIESDGVVSFIKKYEPGSYEIRNELSWLLSTMIRDCKQFNVPNVKRASIKDGYVIMDYIETIDGKPRNEVLDYLVNCATDLHAVLKSEKPFLRSPINPEDYKTFLKGYTMKRVESLSNTEFALPEDIIVYIMRAIDKLKSDYFTIVHRDMRARHLLFPEEKEQRPVLIDWEFSNISEPAQDVAKIIYDAVINGLELEDVKKRVIDLYAHLAKVSRDELEEKTNIFLPIIPLERDMSLIGRKPNGYELELLKDMAFIRTMYEENQKNES